MTSKYHKAFPCRCRYCRARRTLPKHPSKYLIRRYARCYSCGRDALSVDRFRKHKEGKRYTCHCDGVHYPHRRGSLIWCIHHPTGPTEADFMDRYQ